VSRTWARSFASGHGAPGFDVNAREWSTELADRRGGPIEAHNDVCPENVVFRGGEAVALLDFDFVAPGRAIDDVGSTISMWAPAKPRSSRCGRPQVGRKESAATSLGSTTTSPGSGRL
jgi:aminoglycoside phosphotransferase (APT) family kinase protein